MRMLSLPEPGLYPRDAQLPPSLENEGASQWERLASLKDYFHSDSEWTEVRWLVHVSPFVGRVIERYGEAACNRLFNPLSYARSSASEGHSTQMDERALMRHYRALRDIEMARIAALDLLGRMPLNQMLEETSYLADALLMQALEDAQRLLEARYGRPTDAQGEVPLIVLGMGKLGGRELNFSSDIDLIFAFLRHGETSGGRQSVPFELYFGKVVQLLTRLLGEHTADGQPFRIDLRLRPFGQSGPLVSSVQALIDYYHEQGRMWERYALVKARVIGADQAVRDEVEAIFRPFIYRRYLDYSAIDALRKMKLMINQEARRKGVSHNIKLGLGGIREIEFIAQVFQLIRGGRESEFQTRSLIEALSVCEKHRTLDAAAVDDLLQSYAFLRKVEHVLQEVNDTQTQTLPSDFESQQRVLLACGYEATPEAWEAFLGRVSEVMATVHRHFLDVIGGEADLLDSEDSEYAVLWQDMLADETALDVLSEGGAEDPNTAWEAIQSFRDVARKRPSGPRGRELQAQLVPIIIEHALSQKDTTTVLQRTFGVLAQIMSRTTYLELLAENQSARKQLIFLCGSSPWIAHLLAKFPWLLDELIDPVQLYQLPAVTDYHQHVGEYMMRLAQDDIEGQMDTLRHVKQIFQLKVAAADLNEGVHLMRVSDHLTFLAEAILEHVVLIAWRELVHKHGTPPGRSEDDTGFAVIAYGKLGGYELGYGSDLDLVFLCEDDISGQTDGARPIDVQQFYLRLAQKVLHLCTTRTSGGVLYEVDMRLRPSGQSGLLVVRIGTYKEYLQKDAWTWELQALVRARMIFGTTSMYEKFAAIRKNVICRARGEEELREDVLNMRWKMRNHLWQKNPDFTDVKHVPGGMTDIEFLAQYLVLRWSHEVPDFAVWTDNIRILETADTHKVLPAGVASGLIAAYQEYRIETHRLALAERGALSERDFSEHQHVVSNAWEALFGEPPQAS